ncbi:MAG: undecaprenyldiphospho-muramoylpentapeptide beta-N-acetylglucosaminyltransferase [Paenibacillaceae bacterium ZCTH02-B3]|nr:MAG: undecaprenyldiphospho-muramoylpentapeptide beta-N-acetylglucosaminyltransferase [Paenibacillaceae bacterium ZCTH02-B3]
MRVVLTGGGTGGHIYPALAIGQEVLAREPDSELLYIGNVRGLESRVVPQRGIRFEALDVTGFRRSLSWHNVRAVWRFLAGVRWAKGLLREFRPDIVVGTGGYVCGPVVYAAARLGIPTLIHEQNVVPGLANRFLARHARAVAYSFADSEAHFRRLTAGRGRGKGGVRLLHSGNPCASAAAAASPERGFASLGFAPGTPFVLVVGGSGGAKAINEAAAAMVPFLDRLPDVRFVFVTGEKYFEEISAGVGGSPPALEGRLKILPYIHNMPEVLAAASLVVSRAGASFLSEITAVGVPAILIPSPNVTGNHQQPNAESLARKGAAIMILERDLTGEALFGQIAGIMRDPDRRRSMAAASRALGKPEAAALIYEEMRRLTAIATPNRQ